VLGRQEQVKNPTGDAQRRRLLGQAKERTSDNTIVGDPTVNGAVLTFFATGTTSTSQDFTLPAGGWRAIRGGFKYRDSAGAFSAITSAQIQLTPRGTFAIKAKAVGKNGLITVVPPNPGTGGCVRLAIVNGDTYHALFGAGSQIRRNDARVFVVKKPTTQGFCPATGTTTTTTATATSTTATSTSTTTAAPTSTTTGSGTTSTSTSTTTTHTTTTAPSLIQCCLPGSVMGAFTCSVETAAQCVIDGGNNHGAGTCSPDPCLSTTTTTTTVTTTTTPSLIQCCLPGSVMGAFTCSVETAAQCTLDGGNNLGAGTCTPDPCGSPTTTTTVTTTTAGPTTTTTSAGSTTTTTTLLPCGGVVPACIGSCPAGQVCTGAATLDPCTCMTTTTTTTGASTTTTTLLPCGGVVPACIGSCPAGQVCTGAATLDPCTCMTVTTTTTTLPPTTTTTTATTTTTLCADHTFDVAMTSSAGGALSDAQWPGGTVTQCTTAGCCVTLNRPSGDIVLIGALGDHWTVASSTGFSSCALTTGCATNGGTCTSCNGVDAPTSCPPLGIPNCTSNRPSCSSGLNGSASDTSHVQCVH
jgi:hypothetical protein